MLDSIRIPRENELIKGSLMYKTSNMYSEIAQENFDIHNEKFKLLTTSFKSFLYSFNQILEEAYEDLKCDDDFLEGLLKYN